MSTLAHGPAGQWGYDPWPSGPQTQHGDEDEMNTDMTPVDVSALGPGASPEMMEQGVQRVGTSYATAMRVQVKRDLAHIRAAVVEEASIAGSEFYYEWGAGKNKIAGASEALAFELARQFGNCVVEQGDIQNLPDAWIFTTLFIDLETGATISRQFRMAKDFQIFGKHDEARKMDMRFAIGQSKCARNVILKAMPRRLVRDALDAAMSGMKEKIGEQINRDGIEATVDSAIEALAAFKVSEERVLAALDLADRKAITAEHLVTLAGQIKAIRDGVEFATALFPAPDTDGGPMKAPQRKAQPPPEKTAPASDTTDKSA